jgi:hypothetical protein
MTEHTTQSATPPALIHRTARINAAVFRATEALESTRAAAWSAAMRDEPDSEREDRFAAVVSAAVAELAALAHGVEEVAS